MLQINNLGYLSQDDGGGDDYLCQGDGAESSISSDSGDELCQGDGVDSLSLNGSLSPDGGDDMFDSQDESELCIPTSENIGIKKEEVSFTCPRVPPILLPPRFKNVYGTKGAKKRWLQEQRLKQQHQLHESSSCPCVFCNPLPQPVRGMRRSS